MSLSEYFEQHEGQAFVAKALATAVAIILVKNFFPCLVTVPHLLVLQRELSYIICSRHNSHFSASSRDHDLFLAFVSSV